MNEQTLDLKVNNQMLNVIMAGIKKLSIEEGLDTYGEIMRQVEAFNKAQQEAQSQESVKRDIEK